LKTLSIINYQLSIIKTKQRVAVAVNAELTLLYWHIGHRIYTQILNQDRATYGKQIISTLAQQLTQTYGKGWSKRQLWHCVHFVETFPNLEKVNTLCSELSWSHLRIMGSIEDPLKRDFYLELAQLERWSVRQLRERIDSMLYERTALSPNSPSFLSSPSLQHLFSSPY